jgi:hypothetical protein
VKLLISKGADVNIKSFRERIPVFSTIVSVGKSKIIRYLIEHGSDINTTDQNGVSLLRRACGRKYPEIVTLLLEKGVNLPTELNDVQSHISLAVYVDHPRMFNLLLQMNPGIDFTEFGPYLVRQAAENGSTKTFTTILKMGFDLQVPDEYGSYAIHLAAKGGHLEMAQTLLKQGVDINITNMLGKGAIHVASDYDRAEMVEYLASQGAKQEAPAFPTFTGQYIGQERPGDEPLLFMPGIVSLEELEHSPLVFSRDGKEAFWTTDSPMVIMQIKSVDGKWQSPKASSFNSEFSDGEPVFSFDNNKLFFLSNRSLDGKSKDVRERIWFSERRGDDWSEAKSISEAGNSIPMHWTISIDEDDSVYFAATHGSGFGKHDIYKTPLKNGQYQTPENLGAGINSDLLEHTPYMARDKSYMILSINNHPDGLGLMDLFVSYQKQEGGWTKPVSLGDKINTSGQDLCPQVTPDGKYMFFHSNYDIYWVSTGFLDRLRPAN